MTKFNTFNEQEELFTSECKLINLRYEYTGYTGEERWAIITELSEKELWDKYPDVINRYVPFVLLSMAQGEVIDEAHRNDHKHEVRAKRTYDAYGYEDDISEQFHKELITPFIDYFEMEEQQKIEEEKELKRRAEIDKVRKVISMLPEIQKQRLFKYVLEGKSFCQIAEEEGTYHSSVRKSVMAAEKNFKKFYETI